MLVLSYRDGIGFPRLVSEPFRRGDCDEAHANPKNLHLNRSVVVEEVIV